MKGALSRVSNGLPSDTEESPDPLRLIRTKGGDSLELSADKWVLTDGVVSVSLNFAHLSDLSKKLMTSVKATLGWYAGNSSAQHVKNLFERFLHFVRSIATHGKALDRITAADLLSYRSNLPPTRAWYFGTLSGLLKQWNQLGYSGIDQDVLILLEQIKTQGNAKGVAVMTLDPYEGPLTPIESESLQAALNDAFANEVVTLDEFILAWLYVLFGQRNIQYAALKVSDVVRKEDTDQRVTYSIMMPSAKKKNLSARDRLVERPLIEQFGEIIFEYARSIRNEFSQLLENPDQAPLFPNWEKDTREDGYRYHCQPKHIGIRLKRIFAGLNVRSERTGQFIAVTGRRFRRTIATRAAEEGHGPLVIAALLDHADTQNVGVYSASTPAIIDRIDRAIALQMAPLAQAFAGVLIDRNDRDVDPNRRIVDLRIDRSGSAMGQCGKHGFCGFSAPIACYTCSSFEAWPDGPHEAVLSHLLERREQLMAKSDSRMASINDRTILAVASVVQRCAEINKDKLKAIDG